MKKIVKKKSFWLGIVIFLLTCSYLTKEGASNRLFSVVFFLVALMNFYRAYKEVYKNN